jgi:hypothetical protein
MKKETVEIYVDLTESEVNKKSRELADVLTEAAEIKDELTSHQKTEKARIEAKEVRAKELIHVVKTGKEKRSFECEVEKNYDKKEWEYKSDGKVIKTESFEIDDFQREIKPNDDLGDKDQVLPEEPLTVKREIRYSTVDIKNGKDGMLQFHEDFANPGETIHEAAERVVELFNKTRGKKVLARKLTEAKLKE